MRGVPLILVLAAAVAPARASPASPQNVSWGSLWLFEATRPVLKAGTKLTVVYIHCDLDETTPNVRRTCKPGDLGSIRARRTEGPTWKWLRSTFDVVDDQPTAAELRGTAKPRSDRIVVSEIAVTTMQDEVVAEGCGGHVPCDPTIHTTGRKIPATSTSVTDFLGDNGYVGGLASVFELAGAKLVSPKCELLLVIGSRHDGALHVAYTTPWRGGETLSYLETVEEADPIVRLALAYDRALIAARIRDAKRFAAAYIALAAEVAKHAKVDNAIQAMLPTLTRIAKGELGFSAPLGLDAYVSYDP